jgi:hypothetical protein
MEGKDNRGEKKFEIVEVWIIEESLIEGGL